MELRVVVIPITKTLINVMLILVFVEIKAKHNNLKKTHYATHP